MEVKVWYRAGSTWKVAEKLDRVRGYELGDRVEVYGRVLEVVTVKVGNDGTDVYVDETTR